jgi:hypothetical protein
MKKQLYLLLITALPLVLPAQDSQGFISLQAGPSIPVGGFHSKELPDGGFALAGINLGLEGAWYFKDWIGVGGSACMNLHTVDAEALGNAKMAGNEFLTSLIIRSDPYFSVALYAGLFFKFPVAPKLFVTAKATGGYIYAQTPYQLYKAEYYMLGKNWYEVTPAGDYDASFLTGAGLRYDLNDYLGFLLQGDFTYNVMDFTFLTSGGGERTDQKVMSFVNVTAGVVLKIK